MSINIDDKAINAIRAITFGGSMGLDILQPFNTVAKSLPPASMMILGGGAAIIVPPTDRVLTGAGKAKSEIATSLRFVVRVDAAIGQERARYLKGFLVNFFGNEVKSSCLDPVHDGGKLHFDVGVQLQLTQRAVDLAQEIHAQLRAPAVA